MEIIKGGVTAAKGFEAAAVAAQIKYQGRTDMALIYSEKPCKVAGTFTTNVVKAAPVRWDRQIVENKQKSQAVIINSGIANACTGVEGMMYCQETAKEAAKVLGIEEAGVLVGCCRQGLLNEPERFNSYTYVPYDGGVPVPLQYEKRP